MGGVFSPSTAIAVFAELIREGQAVGIERGRPHHRGRSFDLTVALSNDLFTSPAARAVEAEYWETRPVVDDYADWLDTPDSWIAGDPHA